MTPCPVCGSTPEAFEDAQLGCLSFHCPHCELIFKSPACFPDEAAELKKYREHNNSLENEGYVRMFETFIDYTLSHTRTPVRRVLDFGSGPTPVLAELLRRRGFSVDIYDKYFAPDPLAENARYDLVTSTEVIEHIADPLGVTKMLANRLVPGGTLALMTQFHDNDTAAYLKWWYRRDPTHLCFFTPRTFEIIAEKSGLEIVTNDRKKTILLTTQNSPVTHP